MKKIIIFFLLLYTQLAFGQKEANIWYFGRNAGINFSSGEPVAITNGLLNTFEGCSTISDENGNLLFYSDGTTVWNKNHSIMPNGTGLLGNSSSSQSALIIPNPTITNIFYLFTVDAQENNTNGVHYSIIDMNLSGGNGAISQKNIPLIDTATEKITAVVGKTCDSLWVITADTQNFYTYEITTSGVNSNPIISSLNTSLGTLSSRGYLKVSPDGTKIAMAAAESGTFLYDFDITNGTIYNKRELDLNFNNGYGVEFSISGNKLYVSTGISSNGGQANLYQFDVSNPDINIINNSRGNAFFSYSGSRGALQIGPNGKIYHAVNQQTYLGVINFPEENKNAINYIHNGINLNGRQASQGLPPFIQSYFLPTTILNADTNEIISYNKQYFCYGIDYYLKAGKIAPNATYLWEKEGVFIGNDSILKTNNINYGDGIYDLTIRLNDVCNTTLTAKTDISFVSQPTINSVSDFEKCDNDANPSDGFTSFDLSSKEQEFLNNQPNVIIEFFNQSDINFTNPLPKTNYVNQTNPETIIAKASFNSSNNSNCYTIGYLTLNVLNSNVLTNHLSDVFICETDLNASNNDANNSLGTGDGVYDLSEKISEIQTINSNISLATHNIDFYRSINDLNNKINPMTPPYQDYSFTNNSTIFVSIESKNNNNCPTITSFNIYLNSLPIPKGNLTPLLLCTKLTEQNATPTTIELNGATNNSSDTYQWYKDGEIINNATNAIFNAFEEGIYKVEAYRFNSNTNNYCTGYNTFTVNTSSKALIIDLITTDNTINNNNITIKVKGEGIYEYSLNNHGSFSDGNTNFTNTFYNLPIGIYRVYIRDKNGCGVTISDEIPIIFFQKHCTPNNDGIYDTWKIIGVDNSFFTSVKVNIYDRFGKRVAIIPNKNHLGWNGVYNGKKLPSNDYWYEAILVDKNGLKRIKKSHFSLLRR